MWPHFLWDLGLSYLYRQKWKQRVGVGCFSSSDNALVAAATRLLSFDNALVAAYTSLLSFDNMLVAACTSLLSFDNVLVAAYTSLLSFDNTSVAAATCFSSADENPKISPFYAIWNWIFKEICLNSLP